MKVGEHCTSMMDIQIIDQILFAGQKQDQILVQMQSIVKE